MTILGKIFGDANERYIKSLGPTVDKINGFEKDYEKFSDGGLKDKTREFKERLAEGEPLDNILPEAFAAVREAAKRTLGQRHFDVQLIGGIVLHQGKIAEMKTGEGKTLVATLPAYLNALVAPPVGGGVHVITVNDYLARRDTVWMGQIYNALGLSTGCINHEASYVYDPSHIEKDEVRDEVGGFKVIHEFLRPVTRREAYEADITYGTNNEYGFDYLRDNMAYDPSNMVQLRRSRSEVGVPTEASGRIHHFAIVDEVDSILIDEARTPLIISAPDEDSAKLYQTFAKVAPHLRENDDYNVDEKQKAVSITEAGIEKVEKTLGLKNIYEEGGIRYVHHLEQALKAEILFKRDRDYVIKDGEVIIVDEFTGRLMPGRRWSEGLHQAVEAKEGVNVQKESKTLATITFQNYFRLYEKLAGMTGTAQTSAEEFHKVYKLDVVTVPTNQLMIRIDSADRIYKTETGKFRAVVREIKERHDKGQSVLVGTVSIEKNELLAAMLEREGVPYNILNAKNHEKEAEIIAQAGRAGAVTVATNMAGRGVDIMLGGNPIVAGEAEKAREAGGLHVIGTERHEARRIDDQLRGRSGRQGDPGSSQFFVSTEDDLVRIFAGDRLKNIMERLGVGEDDVIENKFVSSAIREAQAKVEGHNFDIRKYVLEYDDVMNKHREAVYGLRKEILFSDDCRERVIEYLQEQITNLVNFHVNGASVPSEGDGIVDGIKEIAESIQAMIGPDKELYQKLIEISKSGSGEEVINYLNNYMSAAYELKEKENGPENMRKLEKFLLLRVIDEIWMDHIETMTYLRESVSLRAYGQRDPLIEYKVEAQKLYQQIMGVIKSQVTNLIFKVGFMQPPRKVEMREEKENVFAEPGISTSESGKAANKKTSEVVLPGKKIGRNDPCPCGSKNSDGTPKKFKKCHGK